MRSGIGMAGLLALAACGSAEAPENAAVPVPAPSPTPGPKLGGVDLNKPLRASGAGWTLDIAPGQLTYQAGKAPPVELYPIAPTLSGDRARYVTSTTDDAAVTIDLIARQCDEAPLTVEATVGARSLKGCAQPR